jgi:hypothetical protein
MIKIAYITYHGIITTSDHVGTDNIALSNELNAT